MNHETLWEGWSLAYPEVEEERPSLPEDTEVLISPEKPDGSIFIYYRHELTDSLENDKYWSTVFSPDHKDTISGLLYPDSFVWADDQHCSSVQELLKIRDDRQRSRVAMVSKHMQHPKTGADYRFIDIWSAAWNSYAAGQLASFVARNVTPDEVQMRVVSIHPEMPRPQDRNQTLFYGTLRKFRQQAVRAAE